MSVVMPRAIGGEAERHSLRDTEVLVHSSAVSTCCVLEQGMLPTLCQSIQLNDEYQMVECGEMVGRLVVRQRAILSVIQRCWYIHRQCQHVVSLSKTRYLHCVS